MNNFEQYLINALLEMRKGPEDTTHVPAKRKFDHRGRIIEVEPQSGRSAGEQDKRDVFAGELKKHRKEVAQLKRHGTAEYELYSGKATPEDHKRVKINLNKMRRRTGQDEIPHHFLPHNDKKYKWEQLPRGRTANVSGDRTNPTQYGKQGGAASEKRAQGIGNPKLKAKSVSESFEEHLISVLLEGSGGIKKLTRKEAALRKAGRSREANLIKKRIKIRAGQGTDRPTPQGSQFTRTRTARQQGRAHAEAENYASVSRYARANSRGMTPEEHDDSERITNKAMNRARTRGAGSGWPV